MIDDDYEKIKREMVFDRVSKAIKEDRKNCIKKVEDLGFKWYDDSFEDEEELEEKKARSENSNQDLLVSYFEGDVELSGQVLDAFLNERSANEPNDPLIRKYFRQGNENLKKLIISGLERNPADIELLSDLTFFHEFKNILSDLIIYYLIACEHEKDLQNFEELASDFYYHTEPDGFDALYELAEKYGPDSDKGKIVRKIIQEIESEPDSLEF
jgi:hypothetical protein